MFKPGAGRALRRNRRLVLGLASTDRGCFLQVVDDGASRRSGLWVIHQTKSFQRDDAKMLFEHALRVISFENPLIKSRFYRAETVHFDGNCSGEQTDRTWQENFARPQNAEFVAQARFRFLARELRRAKLASRKIDVRKPDQRFGSRFIVGRTLRRARSRSSQRQMSRADKSISRHR